MPSSSAPSTVSNSASSPAAWPSVRFRPRCWRPAAVAVHHARDVGRGCGSGRCRRAGVTRRSYRRRDPAPATGSGRSRYRRPRWRPAERPTGGTSRHGRRRGRDRGDAASWRRRARSARRRRAARRRRGPARPADDGRRRRRGHRAAAATSSCRPAPAPASPSPTWCPALLSGRRVVVATATKALQDQLAGKDLPFLAEHLDVDVRRGRAEGPLELRLPPAPARGARVTTTRPPLELDELQPGRCEDSCRPAGGVGRRRRRPATGPS